METDTQELTRLSIAMGDNKAIETAHDLHEAHEYTVSNTCNLLGVSEQQIYGTSRIGHIKDARHIAMYLLCEKGYSLSNIGKMFGKDHSTVIHARDRVLDATIKNDKDFYNKIKLFV